MLIVILGDSEKLNNPVFDPDVDWKKEFSKLYLKFLVHFKGKNKAVKEFRKHLSWIFKGTRGISRARGEFLKIDSFEGVIDYIDNI
jgi:tRNA-dihydrouridine synthase